MHAAATVQQALELKALMADEKKLHALVAWRKGLDLGSTMWGMHNGPVSQAVADLAWDTDQQQPTTLPKPSPKPHPSSAKSLDLAHSEEMVDVTAHHRAVCSLCDHARVAKLKASHPFKPVKPPLTREEAAAKLGLPAEAARVRRKVTDDQ